jgi:hypothetical protein
LVRSEFCFIASRWPATAQATLSRTRRTPEQGAGSKVVLRVLLPHLEFCVT